VLKRTTVIFLISLLTFAAIGQDRQSNGVLSGNVMNEQMKALEGATAQIVSLRDTTKFMSALTDKNGEFTFNNIAYGHYRLIISYVGLQPLVMDSIHFRSERADFNLTDLTLKPANSESLGEVIVYAEKPLIQSRDGNITFNAAESALSAGANASDLLASVPMIAKDADGNVTVRGKEPKILIDDKPVELSMQQLQELLESMPGSAIEKIEVMTNPPPQYANEQGGVINIVTRKGNIGKTGRLNISGGTRGEATIGGNYTYRKQGLVFSVNAGVGYSRFEGHGYSYRNNIYADSSNFFNTRNNNANKNLRPNLRVNMEYDFNKFHSINAVVQLNSGDSKSSSLTEYQNINRFGDIYDLSERTINTRGENYSGSLNLSYLMKTNTPGEQLRIIASSNLSANNSNRSFYQQFFFPDHTPTGYDSTQQQLNKNSNSGYNIRADYTKPLKNQTTILNLGSYYNRYNSNIDADASYLRKTDTSFINLDQLSNNLRFHQTVINFRGSVKQTIAANFTVSAGLTAEQTGIWFELLKQNAEARNNYWTLLPFANINKSWPEILNLTLSWRRSIRRPGINELNPTIDFSDPYNVRFGNENLEASTSDNFDFVIGRTKNKYYVNLGLGFNNVKDIFSRIRTLLPDGKTQTTWANISGRKEYEVSTWGGITIARKLRANVSASYTFNQYSEFDRTFNRYRNGGSFRSNMNTTYTPVDKWTFTGSSTFNRFADPQGFARWNWSMNLGIQRRFFNKKLVATVNFIDIFAPQRNRSFTYGPNFSLENYSTTNTKNIRFTLAYNFTKTSRNKQVSLPVMK
jgi:hypothetical protein